MKDNKRYLLFLAVLLFGLFIVIIFFIYRESIYSNLTTKNTIESNMIAYIEGHSIKDGGGVFGGDLWIMNVDDKERKKITENARIQWLHDWSPDNKYVVVIRSNDEVSVVNIKTGEIIDLGQYKVRYKIYWISDTEIAFLQSDKLSVINIENKSKDDLLTLPDELSGAVLSPDAQWVAANDSPFGDMKLYSYNLKQESLNTLSEERSNFGDWLNGYILYSTETDSSNAIMEIDANGNNKKKLIDIGDSTIAFFSVSKNNNAIAYITYETVDRSTIAELYVYDYVEDLIQGPLNDSKLDSTNKMSGLEISKNGGYINYHLGDGVRGMNIANGEIFDICTMLYCDASWSN